MIGVSHRWPRRLLRVIRAAQCQTSSSCRREKRTTWYANAEPHRRLSDGFCLLYNYMSTGGGWISCTPQCQVGNQAIYPWLAIGSRGECGGGDGLVLQKTPETPVFLPCACSLAGQDGKRARCTSDADARHSIKRCSGRRWRCRPGRARRRAPPRCTAPAACARGRGGRSRGGARWS